ncbi:TetR/AcrR family transcriptional regulator [Arthrobacter sp. PAMC25564]|uniref:TetR/AcrR family transcriptional regulator n=1 Tax=Arthrobacter sp. PAMC25564 TaxID=2565366 RepID=UPI0010A29B60|nr:TetR/AcrR family transcriptional regulator [Arthrobacter sp. PAMC25564]QCB96291.1 TetR/AcrR family transcriptional regulator [Arthrobacter sp. PAMC25564]
MPRKTERRHLQGDVSRQKILEAALDIAAERGYDGTSVAAVTERTGLPASSIYWHFKNKDELLAEALDFSYRRWREVGPPWLDELEPLPLASQVQNRFRQAAAAYVAQPEFWRLGLMLALEQRIKEPAARTRYIQVRRESQAALTDWWGRVLASTFGPVDPAVPETLARFHLAALDGLFVATQADRTVDVAWVVDTLAGGLSVAACRLAGGRQ